MKSMPKCRERAFYAIAKRISLNSGAAIAESDPEKQEFYGIELVSQACNISIM